MEPLRQDPGGSQTVVTWQPTAEPQGGGGGRISPLGAAAPSPGLTLVGRANQVVNQGLCAVRAPYETHSAVTLLEG